MYGGHYQQGQGGGHGGQGNSYVGSGPPPGMGPPPPPGGRRGGSSGAGPILEKNAYVADRPTRQRKTLRGIRLPILFAGLIVLVAVVGGSVYLFAFGGLEEVQGFFAPPSASPTASPILGGLVTQAPTQVPTRQPTNNPTNQPITESPTNQPTNNPTNQPTTETPTTATGQPTTDQPTTDQPTTDQPTTSQPTTDQPTTDQPTTDQPTTSQPTTDQPTTDQPTTDQPTTSQPTTSQPTTFTGAPTPLPTTLRSPTSPYIVVTFTSPPSTPTAAVTAFDNAAARWSSILAGTNLIAGTVPGGSTFNGFSCSLNTDATIPVTLLEELHIAADISGIDGVGGILGQAGPCGGFLQSADRPGVFLPVLGQMTFDSADLGNLEAAGELEDVILHEMGHVLGLGTLWQPDLVEDLIFPNGLTNPQPGNSPRYTGHGARSEYVTLSGTDEDIPLEDGSFQGLSAAQILAGQGFGSIDGHWLENLFVNELMTPAIGGSVNPMSIMTLRSLEDIGYGVDTSQADAYSIPSSSSALSGSGPVQHKTVLEGDIFHCPDIPKALQKAKNRARARRRLGGPTQSLLDG